MTINDWLIESSLVLKKAGIDSARLDCLMLLEQVTKNDRAYLLSHLEDAVSGQQLNLLNQLLARRKKRMPMAYILGYKEFYGLKLRVSPAVLIPRPETETLIEYLATMVEPKAQLLDLGTGSGAIAVSLKVNRPDLNISASDISSEALDVAQENAKAHKATISFIKSDMFESITKKYDWIVANLPYLNRENKFQPELTYEPATALYSDHNGLDHYIKLLSGARAYLNSSGKLLIEHGPTQFKEIKNQLSDNFSIHSINKFVSLIS